MRRSLLAPRVSGRNTSLRRLLPVALLGAVVALSGCQTQSPIQTDVPYSPGDGVPVDLAAVQLRDLVIVSDGKDKPGVLSASVINNSGQAQRIAFALPNAEPVFAEAAAHSEKRLSNGTQVTLPNMPVAPGDVVTLSVQSSNAPAAVVMVPVVPASGYYSTLRPTPATPTTATATTPAG